jgi:hypothetical protein
MVPVLPLYRPSDADESFEAPASTLFGYAKALAQAVACPTLAVPDGAPLCAKGLFVKILCPMMDLSAASTEALRQALTLAYRNQAEPE